MFRRKITRLGVDAVITEIFCWQEHMISSVWISTLLSWEKTELKEESRRGAETWVWSYPKIRIGPSLLLHGSEYVHLCPVYIPTFTYLFLLPKSHFLPFNHTQRLSFLPLFIFPLSVHCTSKQHRHWRANSPSVSTRTASMSRTHEILWLRSYHEPDEFCRHAHALNPKIHSNIIFSSSPWPTGWDYWTKALHEILSAIMQNICPFNLMLYNWPNQIITKKFLKGLWMLHNSRTGTSQCKICRWPCATIPLSTCARDGHL